MPSVLDPSLPIKTQMERLVRQKQQEICLGLETLESNNCKFHADEWQRGSNGGGGKSMVLADGETFEKAGVNVSVVHGILPPGAIERMKVDHKDIKTNENGEVKFFACGLSMVLHPWNPHAPTMHLNYRYFEITNPDDSVQTWWFGGGADLTPSYFYLDDAKHFHGELKNALDEFDGELYPEFKLWCDKYFYIPHRNETRGVGGIFFDDFNKFPPQQCLQMIERCFDAMLPSYVPLVAKRKDQPYTEKEKEWQQIRRGRYVEFNLVYDRGTKFGLQTPGSRIESILMSLPKTATWLYNHEPEKGSKEAELLEITRSPISFV